MGACGCGETFLANKRGPPRRYCDGCRIENRRTANTTYRRANPEKRREGIARWRGANPERVRTSRAAYYASNAKKEREAAAAWQKANPERARSIKSAWHKANPNSTAQRLRRYGVKPEMTAVQWREILVTNNHCCAYCGTAGPMTKDHVIPLSRGGTDNKDNILPACNFCNCSKGAKPLLEWLVISTGFSDGSLRTGTLLRQPPT